MRFLITILLISAVFELIAQPSAVDIRLRKSLRDKLDDLVFDLQVNGRLENQESYSELRRILGFDSEIYDFITPNYVSQKVGREMTKPIDEFLADVNRDFPKGFFQFQIMETNLGTAINYSSINWRDPEIQLIIKLSIAGDYYRGGVFSNEPTLDFRVKFDTAGYRVTNMRVEEVRKVESALMFQKEEKLPFFDKQYLASGYLSYVNVNSINVADDYYFTNVDIQPEISYGGAINFIRRVAAPEPEEFAWSVGIGFTETWFRASVDYYLFSRLTTDRDEDQHYLNVTGTGFDERVRLRIADIPIRFRYERKFNNYLGFYVNPGINLSYLVQMSYFGSGEFTYTGWYPQLDLLLENEEDFNFVSNNEQSANVEMPIPQWNWDDFNVSGALELGFNIEFLSGWMVYLGATAFKNFVFIQEPVEEHAISTVLNEYRGIAPSFATIDNGGYGIQFGIRKRFVSKNGLVKLE